MEWGSIHYIKTEILSLKNLFKKILQKIFLKKFPKNSLSRAMAHMERKGDAFIPKKGGGSGLILISNDNEYLPHLKPRLMYF